MSVIKFNGTSSDEFGCIIEKRPDHARGERRGDLISVPGRNGVFVMEDGSYTTYKQKYSVSFLEGSENPPHQRTAQVAKWLLGSKGFCRLEDGFEPGYYRLARYAGPLNIAQILNECGQCVLEFECQPQRYLESGESAYKFKSVTRSGAGGTSFRVQGVDINPIPSAVSSVQFDILVENAVEPSPGFLRLSNSRDSNQFVRDNLHIIPDPGDWKYTNVMEDSRAQFKAGMRYSFGSKAFVSNNNPACDCVVIPVPANNKTIRIRIKNATFSTYNTIYGGTNATRFDVDYGRHTVNPPSQDEYGDSYFDFQNAGSSYITFNLAPVEDPSLLIVTVDEPITEINADGLIHYTGTLNVTEAYDTVSVQTYNDSDAISKVTFNYADGSTFDVLSFGYNSFSFYNPTDFESRPLLRFADKTPEPVNQNLTIIDDTFINANGEVKEAYWPVQKGKTFTTQPVYVGTSAYVYITASSFTFLDADGNVVRYGFKKTSGSDTENYYQNYMYAVPSGATRIVLGGNVGKPVSLVTQAPNQNPGLGAAAINGTAIDLNFSAHDTIYLDCDVHDAYYVDGSNANAAVTFVNHDVDYPTFPGLVPGENIVALRNISDIDFEIIPRWWEI